MWRRLAYVACVLVGIGACDVITSNEDDGDYCDSESDCDSKICSDVHRCGGSQCETGRDCRDGWSCKEGEKHVIGRAPSSCVVTCAGCPVEWSCRGDASVCLPSPVAIAIDQPAAGTILRRGEKARVHATIGPTVDKTELEWQLDGRFEAHDNDAEVMPSMIGEVKVTVELTSNGQARGTAEATFQVCEPQHGLSCNVDPDCCAPLKCVHDGFDGHGGCK